MVRTGRPSRPPHGRRPRGGPPSAGFVYLGVLFLLFLTGVALAAAGESWSMARQREREEELLFVGDEFRRALASYGAQAPARSPRNPATLEELLEDPRFPAVRRHLRRLYVDPVTGKPEWGLVRGRDGGIVGIHSLSRAAPLKRSGFARRDRSFEGKEEYSQWVFGQDLPAGLRQEEDGTVRPRTGEAPSVPAAMEFPAAGRLAPGWPEARPVARPRGTANGAAR